MGERFDKIKFTFLAPKSHKEIASLALSNESFPAAE
jgi:hypothetical protein